MGNMLVEKIYNNSPVFIQNIACSIKGYKERKIRFGKEFWKYYEFLLESQWMSEQDLVTYQEKKLNELINYCYNNVRYYNEVMKKEKLTPKDIRTVEDLQKLPILTKEIVRNRFEDLKSQNFNDKYILSHTSGSTGKSLDFLYSIDGIRYRWALWFRHRQRFGIQPNDPYATFTGLVAVPIDQKSPPYWRENIAMKQTIFTMHHISKDKVKYIVERLNKGGFAYYSGYPSIIYALAQLIEECGLVIENSPRVIFTGAESLLDFQRSKISEVFGCLVTDQYGFSEGAGNASRCEKDLFHEDFEYGVLENSNKSSQTGEILGTGFTNLAMPFIRYRIGDTATWTDEVCSCGRHSKKITRVEGRNEDFVLTPEGNKILRFDYIFKDSKNVKEAQIVQEELGEITIRIVKRENYSKADETDLIEQVKKKVSKGLRVKFEYPKEIERGSRGKFKAVVSKLN